MSQFSRDLSKSDIRDDRNVDNYDLNQNSINNEESDNKPSFLDRLETITGNEIVYNPEAEGKWFHWNTFMATTGSSFLVAIAFLDPGNIIADASGGAYAQYQLLSVLIVSTICSFFCQRIALTMGAVTGKNLAQVANEYYSRPVSILLWVAVQLAIIGNDIQQIIASAIAFKVLLKTPLWVGSLLTFLDTFVIVLLQGGRKLEAFFALIIGFMGVCFFIDFFMIIEGADVKDIAIAIFYPRIQRYAMLQLVGLVGAVIMPHNLYLHSASIAEKTLDRSRPDHKPLYQAIKYFSIDAAFSMFVATLINIAVISVFAIGFFKPECAVDNLAWIVTSEHPEGICGEISLLNAGTVLETLLGNAAGIVWALGLLAAGQAATATGTFCSSYVMEGFLNLKLPTWKRMLLTRSTAIVPAMAIAIYTTYNQHIADRVDQWLNVLQSIALPFALMPLIVLSSNKKIMGDFIPSLATRLGMWVIGIAVVGANGYLMIPEIQSLDSNITSHPAVIVLLVVLGLLYVGSIIYIVKDELWKFKNFILCKKVEEEDTFEESLLHHNYIRSA